MIGKYEKYMRQEIKKTVTKLPGSSQFLFRRLHNQGNFQASVDEVIDNIPEGELSNAMMQVIKTLNNHRKRIGS